MKIALMCQNAKLYSHQRLIEAAEARGHTIDVIRTLNCYMNIASRRPEIYFNGESLTGYDAVTGLACQ
jgi:ribosomal protein S6--L-glutamate ligase